MRQSSNQSVQPEYSTIVKPVPDILKAFVENNCDLATSGTLELAMVLGYFQTE